MNTRYFITLYINTLVYASLTVYGQASDTTSNITHSEDQCITCHLSNDLMPENFLKDDVHWQQGLSCSGCHGGLSTESDEDAAMSKQNGFVGVPEKKNIPEFCGKCHSDITKMQIYKPRIATDQVAQYLTSKHGKQLKIGDENVATCIDCHTAHRILPASDPRSTVYAINIPSMCDNCHGKNELMSQYGIKTTQLNDYSNSVHGEALLKNHDTGAPACNDCHGNHGAKPPGIESISHVCGSCHVNNMNYFINSSMGEAFADMDIHGCEQCHDYHLIKKPTDEMLGVGEKSACTDCHSEGDEGYSAALIMYQKITELSYLYDSTKVRSQEVNVKGMNNTEIEYALKSIKQNLIQSRTLIHTFDTLKVLTTTREGLLASHEALKLADLEVANYFNRRLGYGIATFILIILALGLYLKIRSLKS